MIAGHYVVDSHADGFDDAGALVPEHHRPPAPAELPVRQANVGVADTGSCDADEHLAGLRRIELDLFDLDGATRLAEDDGSHPTRHCSSASKSGLTPSPGPGGGAIVPSAAISTGCGSSQSRRSAGSPGGSNGTSTNGHVETASARWRFTTRP